MRMSQLEDGHPARDHRNTEPDTRTAGGAARQDMPAFRPVQDGLPPARAAADQPPHRAKPVEGDPVAKRPVPQVDDMTAGLEEAALRDIGDDMASPAEPAEATPARQGRRNRKKNAGQADAAENAATDEAPAQGKRQERRAGKLRRQAAKNAALSAPTTGRELDKKLDKPVRKREKDGKPNTSAPKEWGIPWTAISFLAMVVIPAAIASFYYIVIASPQYQVEAQFAVRGSNQSSMATMGLGSILGGTTTQSGDSYIVSSYVESLQLIRDVQQELGVDLRQFYTRDHIDWLYRIQPDMPLEKFTEYWRSMTDVSYNATTGNTTLLVYGFTAEDSKAIADAVLKVSERLVNQLSENNRQQVMQVASKQVDRAEERLRKVQAELRRLRVDEKVSDPATLIQLRNQVLSGLQNQLSTLKTRYNALMRSVSPEAPQAKSLQKQIDALEGQIAEQEAQLGAPDSKNGKNLSPEDNANLAEVLNKFEELTIEQSFATQAYTTALAAFETAIVEAQRQERYFATFVAPTRPEIALYPLRYLDSFIAFLVLLAAWMVTQFLYRSFRDHAV